MKANLMAILVGSLLLSGRTVMAQDPTVTTAPAPDVDPVEEVDVEKNDEFVAAEERIRKEERFSKLRRDRRDLVERIPKMKAEVDAMQAELAALRVKDRELGEKLATPFATDRSAVWESRVSAVQQRLDELKKRGPVEGQSRKDYESELVRTTDELDFVRARAQDAAAEVAQAQDERKALRQQMDEVRRQVPLKEEETKLKTRTLASLIERQELVEDAINTLLIPETARNHFKLLITAAFSLLVGFVILGFFVIAFRDEVVRRSIFSSQSGIQFLTLFSLVIAIILFGITNILGGKELAALLGGLSGYILGRVTDHGPTPAGTPVAASVSPAPGGAPTILPGVASASTAAAPIP